MITAPVFGIEWVMKRFVLLTTFSSGKGYQWKMNKIIWLCNVQDDENARVVHLRETVVWNGNNCRMKRNYLRRFNKKLVICEIILSWYGKRQEKCVQGIALKCTVVSHECLRCMGRVAQYLEDISALVIPCQVSKLVHQNKLMSGFPQFILSGNKYRISNS